jgi:hypothetical protein
LVPDSNNARRFIQPPLYVPAFAPQYETFNTIEHENAIPAITGADSTRRDVLIARETTRFESSLRARDVAQLPLDAPGRRSTLLMAPELKLEGPWEHSEPR